MRTSSLYTLTAPTGHGKTSLCVIIALAIATGREDILGLSVRKGRVAYLTFENPDDVRMRFMIAAYFLNIDVGVVDADIIILDMRHKPEAVLAGLEKEAIGNPFTLILIDTFAAFFDGDKVTDPVQAGEFFRRLRPMTKLPGLPTVIVACHPIKNATEDNLLPLGAGAIIGEVDGGLTLWKTCGVFKFHWQGKFRGPEFEPMFWRIEEVSSPEVVDAKGRQIMLPVMRPVTGDDAEQREQQDANLDLALIRTMEANPKGTQQEWGDAIGRVKSSINGRLQKLKKSRHVEETLGHKWRLTAKGVKEASNA